MNSASECLDCGKERKKNRKSHGHMYYRGSRNRCPTCYKAWLASDRTLNMDEEPHGRRKYYDDFLKLMRNEPWISIKASARRLGVNERTINRYRQTWRESNAA